MVRFLLIFLAFAAGEVVFFILAKNIYDRFAREGALPHRGGLRRWAMLLSLLLPLIYSLVALVGVFLVFQLVRSSLLPESAGAAPLLENLPGMFPTPTPFSPAEEQAEPTTDGADTQDPTPQREGTVAQPPASEEPPSSPPAGKIVYVCQIFKTGLRDQICLINADGTGYERLTTDDQGDYNFPSLAPDGDSVIYVGKEGEQEWHQVYELDFQGNVSQLTDGEATASAPEISPDGSQVVFSLLEEDGSNTIWLMDRDGENQRRLFGPPQGQSWDPTWSPDGRQILFASDRTGTVQLYAMDTEGANLRQVTDIPELRGRSDWSPEGQSIATYAGESWEREILAMDADGSNPRLLTEGGNNLAPSYSPDGKWIVFTSYQDNYRQDLGCEIYIMERDGTNVTRLTYNDICDWQPRWGP